MMPTDTHNASNPLAELKDIHLPEAISFWPPAAGVWWLVAVAIFTIALLALGYRWWRKKNAYRQAAQQELQQLQAANLSPEAFLHSVALLVRRCSQVPSRSQTSQALQGDAYFHYLATHMPTDIAELIAIKRYQPIETLQLPSQATLALAVSQWIKKHPSTRQTPTGSNKL